MKINIILISIAVFLYTFFRVSTASADVIISEFSIGKYIGGKATSTNGDDFVELYNTGSTCIPLEGWRLRKRIQSGTESPLYGFKKGDVIMPNDFFLWVSSKAKSEYQKLADGMPTVSQEYTLSGNNSIALLDNKNLLKDAIAFGGEHIQPFSPSALLLNPGNGLSLERNLSSLKWEETDSAPNPTGASISTDNDPDGDSCPNQAAQSFPISDPAPVPPVLPDSPPSPAPVATPAKITSIRLNEIFPNPAAKGDAGEFVELYNFGTDPADISSWILRDATKTGKYIFPSDTFIAAATYLSVTDQSFKLSLNNSNETISLFDSSGMLIDSVHYEKTKEDISLNYTPTGWRGGKPTPGAANILNNLPETKERVPQQGYHGVPIAFSAQGKDADGDMLKYAWNFGDGHKSYKAKTSHAYEENGTYIVTLTTTDGTEDFIETFAIKIISYKPPEVRIISLMSNPAGADTANEWILIENHEKKRVNLKGFSIATGWKNLVNHPIREDFFIEPKKTARLTRLFSLFTLPNQKSKVELRAPDGKVLQTIKYKLEKSVAENSVYGKRKGGRWEWQEEKENPLSSNIDENVEVSGEELPLQKTAPADEEDSEKKVLGEQTSRSDVAQKKFLRLLNYGTRVKIPENISLAFDETSNDTTPLPLREHYAVSFAKESLSALNASLNEWLSNAR